MGKPSGIVLAFDYGIKKTGIAIGNQRSQLITPEKKLITMRDGIPPWESIDVVIKEWQPDCLLIGDPSVDINENSYKQLKARIKKFKNRLFDRYNLPCHFVDERLTSFEAEQIHCDPSHAWYRIPIDCISAALILQQWLDTHET